MIVKFTHINATKVISLKLLKRHTGIPGLWTQELDAGLWMLFTEAANHFFNGFRFLELGVNNTTVLSPINGHSQKRTPPVSG